MQPCQHTQITRMPPSLDLHLPQRKKLWPTYHHYSPLCHWWRLPWTPLHLPCTDHHAMKKQSSSTTYLPNEQCLTLLLRNHATVLIEFQANQHTTWQHRHQLHAWPSPCVLAPPATPTPTPSTSTQDPWCGTCQKRETRCTKKSLTSRCRASEQLHPWWPTLWP